MTDADRLSEIADYAPSSEQLDDELRAIANRLVRLVWSSERPRVKGLYWWRLDESGDPFAAHLTPRGTGYEVGEWCGPIPQPD